MAVAGAAAVVFSTAAWAAEVEPGFKSLFNGKDLSGWAGRPQHWSVEDGAITGVTTKEKPAEGNNFLIAKDGDQNLMVSDFEVRFSYRFTGPFGNSGLQYRSKDRGNFVVNGYQGDFEVGTTYSGILYEEGGRGILAERGQKTVVKEADGKTKVEVAGSVGDSQTIQANIKTNGWNDYVIIAKGNHLQHFINGMPTVDVTDEQESKAAKSGILALQLHAGPPMKIQFKDIRIKSMAGGGADLAKMQGDWVPKEVVANGEQVPADRLASVKLNIKGNEFVLESENGTNRGKLKLNESTSPKSMDVTTDSGDEMEAIYEVGADMIKVCYPMNGGSRPTALKSDSGSYWLLTVYTRK
jgi:uncharacterized protein (TIGR03067 family)